MEVRFQNTYLENLYEGLPVTGKPKYSEEVIEKYRKRVVLMEHLEKPDDLRQFKSLRFEALKGDRQGLYSIRVDRKYRLEFAIDKDAIHLYWIILINNFSNHYQ